jgi:hypothetical protein
MYNKIEKMDIIGEGTKKKRGLVAEWEERRGDMRVH